VYWRLFAIENLLRVIIHSVLSGQLGDAWWATAVDHPLQGKAERFRSSYREKPWHTTPGVHEIYYLGLGDLSEIVRANSNLFRPVLDVDQWLARIEQVRLPRNVVAHMNWPSQTDRQRVEVLLADLRELVGSIKGSIQLVAPR
jgi:hypothetical protein